MRQHEGSFLIWFQCGTDSVPVLIELLGLAAEANGGRGDPNGARSRAGHFGSASLLVGEEKAPGALTVEPYRRWQSSSGRWGTNAGGRPPAFVRSDLVTA
jgi:hypothetical protein